MILVTISSVVAYLKSQIMNPPLHYVECAQVDIVQLQMTSNALDTYTMQTPLEVDILNL